MYQLIESNKYLPKLIIECFNQINIPLIQLNLKFDACMDRLFDSYVSC